MNRLIVGAAVIVSTFTSCGPAGGSTGEGERIIESDDVSRPRLALDSGGRPTVAFLESFERGTLNRLLVWRREGATWRQLGAALTEDASPLFLHELRMDSLDRPVVAFNAPGADGRAQVQVRRWNGSGWEDLGGPPPTPANILEPGGSATGMTGPFDMVLVGDEPVVAYTVLDNSFGGNSVRVARRTGTSWTLLGGSSSGAGRINAVRSGGSLALALDPAGTTPWLGWMPISGEAGEEGNIYVLEWTGSTWAQVAAPLKRGADELDFDLTVDGSGRPVLAYLDGRTTGSALQRVHVQSLVAGTWQPTAGSSSRVSADVLSSFPALTLDGSGRPVAWWTETPVRLRAARVTPAGWVDLPDTSDVFHVSSDIAVRGAQGGRVSHEGGGLSYTSFALP